MSDRKKVVVVGAGAFGTALATVAAAKGDCDVVLLARQESVAREVSERHRSEKVLPGIDLSQNLTASIDPTVLQGAPIVLFAMPSQAQRTAARELASYLDPQASVAICAKGMEKSSGRLLTEVLEEELPGRHVAVLSGPGFAADIAKGLPTAMVIAGETARQAAEIAETLSGPTFRLYPSADRIGVQLGGALKNVLAIACGIVEGAGLGDSARAALIARGLAEMSRFVAAHGGDPITVTGLSGLGDLVLTGTSHQSRNLRFGIALGRHGTADGWPGDLVEGAFAASVAASVAEKLSIDMPVTAAVAAIVGGRMDIKTAIVQLMSRPITQE
ncbi:NAD(P)H-dependent glycerol-3-phosphate dehydrogenase [Sinorhizobium sp. BG8]|uniref:NAD(P)H-dependent glycerol-3-phosphate dehydrogenase n=1 Tax=Sinorhizobium sp. BG8 TaxID=2613773 RepID=UPI00193C91A1|nr:NAD(P)H-dependent glycerol-3-phosphate dehydrogenase [Sinorhizobium sp. BG8]QRM53451.1 NAD(P)-dependent glycerol-3-phosphate dehydrogenase [Sinorhizobium sp. BG8]